MANNTKTTKTGRKTKKFNPDFIVDFTSFGKRDIDDILVAFAEAKFNNGLPVNVEEMTAFVRLICAKASYYAFCTCMQYYTESFRMIREGLAEQGENTDNNEKKSFLKSIKTKIKGVFSKNK